MVKFKKGDIVEYLCEDYGGLIRGNFYDVSSKTGQFKNRITLKGQPGFYVEDSFALRKRPTT